MQALNNTAQKVGFTLTVKPVIADFLLVHQRPLPKCKQLCHKTSHSVFPMSSWAGLSRRREHSVACRCEQAKSRAFQDKFKRANMHLDRR